MIERLAIRNYAIIDSLELEFEKGFSVFTGETGAGKSIIIGALGLILGNRADSSSIRQGTDRATVEAEFSMTLAIRSVLVEKGLEGSDDEMDSLIIRREILANGKSRAFVNGIQIPLNVLSELGKWLVDLHGQHDHQLLLDQKQHLMILDGYCQPREELEAYKLAYTHYYDLSARYAELSADDTKAKDERVFLELAVKELSEAGLQKDEESGIESRLSQIENAEKISGALNGVYQKLYEDEASVVSRLQRVVSELSEISSLDRSYAELLEILEDATTKTEESVGLVSHYRDALEYDESEMNILLDRRELIRDFKRKYHKQSVEELMDYIESSKQRLESFENRNEELERITAERETAREELIVRAREVSATRQKAAKELSQKIREELAYLGMEQADFVVDIKYVRDEESEISINSIPIRLTPKGMDRVEFLIGSNKGQGVQPLRKVASGGEISRVMLSVKSVLAENDSIETLIFDEIDTGIGGLTANHVAEKMRVLAQNKQLIVITHLAQIASRASVHFIVSKEEFDAGVQTRTKLVTGEERVEEIARMLGGETEVGLNHAREMLSQI